MISMGLQICFAMTMRVLRLIFCWEPHYIHEDMVTAEAVPKNITQEVLPTNMNAKVTHASLHSSPVSTPNTNAVYGHAAHDSQVIPSVTMDDSSSVNPTTKDDLSDVAASCVPPQKK